MKKILIKALSIVLVCTLAITSMGAYGDFNRSRETDGIYIMEGEDGLFYKQNGYFKLNSKAILIDYIDAEIYSSEELLFRKVSDDQYIPIEEHCVNMDSQTLEEDLLSLGLLGNAIDNILNLKKHKNIELKVYSPISRTTRIYTGWGNKQYYENYYTLTWQSDPIRIVSSLSQYQANNVVKSLVSLAINVSFDFVTLNSYSLGMALFGSNNLPDKFVGYQVWVNADVTETFKDTYLYDTSYADPYIFGSSFVWFRDGKVEQNVKIAGGDDFYAQPVYFSLEKDPLWFDADKIAFENLSLGGYRQTNKYAYEYNDEIYKFN